MSIYKPVKNGKTVHVLSKKKPTKEGFYIVSIPAYGNVPQLARIRKLNNELEILYGISIYPLRKINKTALFSNEIFIDGYV